MITAQDIADEHCYVDVASMLEALEVDDEPAGIDLIHGTPDSDRPAYCAREIWVVSGWLAPRLKEKGQRVIKVGGCQCWARAVPAMGLEIHLDPVLQEIASECCLTEA